MNRHPIQRKTPMKRGKPLRRVSRKRAKELRTYSMKRRAFLAEYPFCQLICAEFEKFTPSTDVHHSAKRGIRLNDEKYWFSCCRSCHDWCHVNGKEARKKFWILDL